MGKWGMKRRTYTQGDPTFNAVVGILRQEARNARKTARGITPLPCRKSSKEGKMTIIYKTKNAIYTDIERLEVVQASRGWCIKGTTKDNKEHILWPGDDYIVATEGEAERALKRISDRLYKSMATTGAIGIFVDIPYIVDGEVTNGTKK